MLYISPGIQFYYHERMKHIDMKCHKLQELTDEDDEEIRFIKVFTKDNITNIITKIITADKLRYCLNVTILYDC